jgi:DNA-directed RNA polymerase specialized sigma24 family protein
VGDVTQLLADWGRGDRTALDLLTSVVYAELRKIADGYLRRERRDHTLQPTALVHEAWMRLVRQDQSSFDNRKQFFALAAQIMRRILVDHGRSVQAEKRGGGAVTIQLGETHAIANGVFIAAPNRVGREGRMSRNGEQSDGEQSSKRVHKGIYWVCIEAVRWSAGAALWAPFQSRTLLAGLLSGQQGRRLFRSAPNRRGLRHAGPGSGNVLWRGGHSLPAR